MRTCTRARTYSHAHTLLHTQRTWHPHHAPVLHHEALLVQRLPPLPLQLAHALLQEFVELTQLVVLHTHLLHALDSVLHSIAQAHQGQVKSR